MIEIGLVSWDHNADSVTVEDNLALGDTQLRVGIDPRTELDVSIGGYASNRLRDRASGRISRNKGFADVTVSLRRGLAGANGPVALQLDATLPTGANGIGQGDWSAGVLLPVTLALPRGLELDLSPELDLAPNSQKSRHHLAWGGVIGLGHGVGKRLAVEAEIGIWRDQDPGGASTDARAALSLAWQAGPAWQLDLEVDQGLGAPAPRRSLAMGLAHRF